MYLLFKELLRRINACLDKRPGSSSIVILLNLVIRVNNTYCFYLNSLRITNGLHIGEVSLNNFTAIACYIFRDFSGSNHLSWFKLVTLYSEWTKSNDQSLALPSRCFLIDILKRMNLWLKYLSWCWYWFLACCSILRLLSCIFWFLYLLCRPITQLGHCDSHRVVLFGDRRKICADNP